jgi:CRAL/TRIO domain
MKHLVHVLEKAIACTKRKSVEISGGESPPLEKFVVVCDYADFSLSESGPVSTAQRTLEILQTHYPERLYRAYVLNPPLVFRVFWAIIRPFVDPATKRKIVFCSGDDEVIEKFTATLSSTESIEPCFGGTGATVRAFDATEYMKLPFDVSFDEKLH